MAFDESRTCPRFRDPSGRPTSTSSPYPTHSVFSTKISGPAISVIVRYSVGISGGPQSLELVVHLGERLRELLVEFRFVLHPRQEFAGLQRCDVLRRDVQFHGLLTEVGVFLDRGDQFELPLGRARGARKGVSRAETTFQRRGVPWVTGSEKSPPLGETAPTTLTDPSRPPSVFARPARS